MNKSKQFFEYIESKYKVFNSFIYNFSFYPFETEKREKQAFIAGFIEGIAWKNTEKKDKENESAEV
jgi:hypothetical protein